jgi:hypothetical protein
MEFIRLIDSIRTELHEQQCVTYFDTTPSGIIIKRGKVLHHRKSKTDCYDYNTKLDSVASLACEHHNQYLYNMVKGEKRKPIFLGHTEDSIMFGLKYKGNKPLLNNYSDRFDYYNDGASEFKVKGECCWGGYTTHSEYRELNSKQLARLSFNTFLNSKTGHRDIILNEYYNSIGVKLTIDENCKRWYVTVMTGSISY